jgi:tetratricopeptide (TPR) repeat protein
MKRLLFIFAFIALMSTVLVRGQSACATLGVNCSHPNVQQRPNTNTSGNTRNSGSGNIGSSSGNTVEAAYDAARSYLTNGNDHLDRFVESHTLSDYIYAEQAYLRAIANVRDFGPAEAGLCRLYEENKEYEKAIAACNVALEKDQKRDFGNHKKAENGSKMSGGGPF